jgi:hypothetical protein
MLDRSKTVRETTETRDGMAIDWDVPVVMQDGLVLRPGQSEVSGPCRAVR